MARLKAKKTYLKPSTVHGHGVFAAENMARGDIIEQCPYHTIQDQSIISLLQQGASYLQHYTKQIGSQFILPLGQASLYNHANNANAKMVHDADRSVMEIQALSQINPHEEIVIYYGKAWVEANRHHIVAPKPPRGWLHAILKLPAMKAAIVFTILVSFIQYIH